MLVILNKVGMLLMKNQFFKSFIASSELEATFSFIINGSSVEVCVETKEAAFLKLTLRDVNNLHYVQKSKCCINNSMNV